MVPRKKDWSELLNLASACIDREVIKWLNKCFESKSFCTPPDLNTIDFDTLWNELKYKTHFFLMLYIMLISVDNCLYLCYCNNKILNCICV